MRPPELIQPPTDDECPPLVRRLFFAAAVGAVIMGLAAAHVARPGFEEVMGWKHDAWGDRDRGVAAVSGLTLAFGGMLAAWQGFSGLPKRLSRLIAGLGFGLSLTVFLGVGAPLVLDYFRRIAG